MLTTTVRMAFAAMAIAAFGLIGPATASAANVENFGGTQQLVDHDGLFVTEWTISDLGPSSDTVPGYPLVGSLWEATANVKAVRGTVTPIIPMLNARADNGQNYHVIWQAFTPQGLSGETIVEGGESNGKIYFDVTGAQPTRVVYNNGVEDVLIWE